MRIVNAALRVGRITADLTARRQTVRVSRTLLNPRVHQNFSSSLRYSLNSHRLTSSNQSISSRRWSTLLSVSRHGVARFEISRTTLILHHSSIQSAAKRSRTMANVRRSSFRLFRRNFRCTFHYAASSGDSVDAS